ncbi:MAG TPA: hypothetical protein VEL07_13705 [Planctomycetota bacterium]|nr:hypothetical protein [Planctomycetota bacterium]
MPAPLPALLCFDVEDLISPESDDAALWMAQMLTEHGLTGSFMIVGEKARLWERRGRRDVIEALKRHHLGYHSTWHSVHPTTTEHCLTTDFAQGIDALWAWDREGWQDTERILGRPLLGWARTGSSWAPSIQGLMGRLGRAYAYSPVRLPGTNVCWYGGCLGFHDDGVGGFDDALVDDARFASRLAVAKQGVDERTRWPRHGAHWTDVFMCHPTRAIHTSFWDAMNFLDGANPPRNQWKPAVLHPAERMPIIQTNFRRLCEWLRDQRQLEIVGWGDLIRRYDGQRPHATHADLLAIASRIARERRVLFTDHFTAAELLVMLCRAVTAPAASYTRPTVLGPLAMPPVMPGPMDATAAAARAAAQRILEDVARTGHLPAAASMALGPAGVGTVFVALAQVLLGEERATGPQAAPYPLEAETIATDVAAEIVKWPIHPKGMDLAKLLEQTRLQCWTLKPAWERKDLGV